MWHTCGRGPRVSIEQRWTVEEGQYGECCWVYGDVGRVCRLRMQLLLWEQLCRPQEPPSKPDAAELGRFEDKRLRHQAS